MKERTPSEKAGLETLQEIRQLMEKSSRFISLSGLSGIAAGLCGLAGAYAANRTLSGSSGSDSIFSRLHGTDGSSVESELFTIGIITFLAAFSLAFFFTWLRSRKNNVPVWGPLARRLLWSVAIPLLTGALFMYRMIELKQFELIAPGCLVFYGLALVNASKYTLIEIRYLGYLEIVLGLINGWMPDRSLLCWAIGFGVLHIIYGAIMWWKYERQ